MKLGHTSVVVVIVIDFAGLVTLLIVGVRGAPAADSRTTVNPEFAARLEALYRRLDDDALRVRQRATLELEQLPAEAVEPLEQAIAAGTLGPEVAMRVESRISMLR